MPDLDLNKQKEKLADLRKQLENLNQEFDRQKKMLGITSDKELDVMPEDLPPEWQDLFAAVKQKAEEAGRQASVSAKNEQGLGSAPARRARRGAISI